MICPIITIQFAEHDIEFDVGPALADLNIYFEVAHMAILQPHTFAAQLGGKHMPEEKARGLMAQAFVEGCIFESRPEMTADQRYAWLIGHPFEYEKFKGIVEMRSNFVEGGNDDAGTAPETSESNRGSDRPSGGFSTERRIYSDRDEGHN